MKARILFIAALSLAILAPAAFAQSGFYIGASSGTTKLKVEGEVQLPTEPPSNPTISDSDKGVRGFVGYRFGRYLALELGYADLGSFGDKYPRPDLFNASPVEVNADAKATDLSVVGILPLADDRVDLYAKLGFAQWDLKVRAVDPLDPAFGVDSFKEDGTDTVYGAGVRFNLLESRKLGLDLGYSRYDLGKSLTYLSGGVSYRFGAVR